MSEIVLSLEHPSLGCGEIVARYDLTEIQEKAYQQGKAEGVEQVLKNIEIGIEATGHSDQYTTGFCNALIWLKSCITNEEPMFLNS